MTLYSKIKDLANTKHVSIAQVERDLNLSNGSMAKWDKHSPKSENIKAVANYFNVSTDYLLENDIADNSLEYFRIDTTGLNDKQIKELSVELKNYSEWAKQKLQNNDLGD